MATVFIQRQIMRPPWQRRLPYCRCRSHQRPMDTRSWTAHRPLCITTIIIITFCQQALLSRPLTSQEHRRPRRQSLALALDPSRDRAPPQHRQLSLSGMQVHLIRLRLPTHRALSLSLPHLVLLRWFLYRRSHPSSSGMTLIQQARLPILTTLA